MTTVLPKFSRDEFADLDIDMRADLERLTDAVKNQAIGVWTLSEVEDLMEWTLDLRMSLSALSAMLKRGVE